MPVWNLSSAAVRASIRIGLLHVTGTLALSQPPPLTLPLTCCGGCGISRSEIFDAGCRWLRLSTSASYNNTLRRMTRTFEPIGRHLNSRKRAGWRAKTAVNRGRAIAKSPKRCSTRSKIAPHLVVGIKFVREPPACTGTVILASRRGER
jgi:hypothetical protein